MALKYELSEFATIVEDEEHQDLTEQEHKNSCDINHMMRSLARGVEVRGSNNLSYGYDDTTMSGLEMRIQKANLERDLAETAKTHEFDEEEFKQIPEHLQKKFGFKQKSPKKPDDQNDEPNDEKVVGKKGDKKEPVKNSTVE